MNNFLTPEEETELVKWLEKHEDGPFFITYNQEHGILGLIAVEPNDKFGSGYGFKNTQDPAWYFRFRSEDTKLE